MSIKTFLAICLIVVCGFSLLTGSHSRIGKWLGWSRPEDNKITKSDTPKSDLYTASDWTKFLDSPTEEFKGNTIHTLCSYYGEGFRRGDRLFSMPITVEPSCGGEIKIWLDIPEDLEIPNIQPAQSFEVWFLCEEGKMEYGNRATKIQRLGPEYKVRVRSYGN